MVGLRLEAPAQAHPDHDRRRRRPSSGQPLRRYGESVSMITVWIGTCAIWAIR